MARFPVLSKPPCTSSQALSGNAEIHNVSQGPRLSTQNYQNDPDDVFSGEGAGKPCLSSPAGHEENAIGEVRDEFPGRSGEFRFAHRGTMAVVIVEGYEGEEK